MAKSIVLCCRLGLRPRDSDQSEISGGIPEQLRRVNGGAFIQRCLPEPSPQNPFPPSDLSPSLSAVRPVDGVAISADPVFAPTRTTLGIVRTRPL